MKNKVLNVLTLAMITSTLIACNGNSVDTVKSLEEKNFELEGKQIEVVGEFDSPFFTISSTNSTTISLPFVVKSHAMSSEKHIIPSLILPRGETKNSAVLEMKENEKNYTLKNFTIYDQNGEKYNLDQHPEFKIKATVRYHEMKKPAENRSDDDFSYELTDVVITKK